MALIPTWPIAAICLAVGVAGGAVSTRIVYVGKIDKLKAEHTEVLRVREVQRARDEVAARQEERRLTLRAGEIEQEKINALNRTRTDADALIDRLRKQASAKSSGPSAVPGAPAACENPAGGAILAGSREDIVRLAQRAAEQQAELAKCYAAYDSTRSANVVQIKNPGD